MRVVGERERRIMIWGEASNSSIIRKFEKRRNSEQDPNTTSNAIGTRRYEKEARQDSQNHNNNDNKKEIRLVPARTKRLDTHHFFCFFTWANVTVMLLNVRPGLACIIAEIWDWIDILFAHVVLWMALLNCAASRFRPSTSSHQHAFLLREITKYKRTFSSFPKSCSRVRLFIPARRD